MTDLQDRRLIVIVGTSHSGSTLLGCVLGASPDRSAFHTGECYNFFHKTQKIYGVANSVWARPDPLWEAMDHTVGFNGALAEIFLKTGASTIVDSGKKRSWVRSLLLAAKREGVRTDVLLSWRSVAGTLESTLKRGLPVTRWTTEMRELRDTMALVGDYKTVDMTRFIDTPAESTRAICAALDLPYFEGKENYWMFPNHHMGGSKTNRKDSQNPDTAGYRPSKPKPAEFPTIEADDANALLKIYAGLEAEILEHRIN